MATSGRFFGWTRPRKSKSLLPLSSGKLFRKASGDCSLNASSEIPFSITTDGGLNGTIDLSRSDCIAKCTRQGCEKRILPKKARYRRFLIRLCDNDQVSNMPHGRNKK